MAKATHKGHCQACGRLQMLPSGKLALHGYSVTHGFFSGVCVGSKEFPFEVSCDLVKLFIANAKEQLAGVEKFQKKLRKAVAEGTTTAWFHTRHADPKGFGYRATYRWAECTIRMEKKFYSDGSDGFYLRFFRDGDTKSDRKTNEIKADETAVFEYSSIKTVEEAALKANTAYADWLEHEADSLRRYIAWQTERVTTWKPAPLLPVVSKDKEGFEPTAPRY